MLSLPSLQNLGFALIAVISFLLVKTVYRLFLHPLSKFPGPKLAAATTLYNAYYDIVDSGLVKRFPELHAKYGPIIRIQPNEIHVADLQGYNQIHRVGTPFDRKWHNNPFLTGSLQSQQTLTETKKRRELLSPFFSKAAINRVEPLLHRAKITQFLDTLGASARANNGKGTVIDFFLGFRCLTTDLIMDYCFQQDFNSLSAPGFQSELLAAVARGPELAQFSQYFARTFVVISAVIFSLPKKIRAKYFAPVYGFQTMQDLARERVEHIRANPDSANGSKIPTMFDAMMHPDEKKGQVTPSKRDMVADGCLMIVAGMDTTANTLGLVLWHVTQNVEVERRLVDELKTAMPDRNALLNSAQLDGEEFEYLRAIVKEALRLSYGVPGRIIRKVPKEGATFSGQYIPGDTIITSAIYMQNNDPATFPNPTVFDPTRWLCDQETYKLRDRQMLTFSRGSRSCIGMNLAYATLHLTVAHLFRRFDITTTGYTTEWDMEWRDNFIPVPNGWIKGLVRERLD